MNASALEEPQSGGMGEGWSDYIACTINDTDIVGNWVVNNSKGIRMHPYDSNYPNNFGDIGRGEFDEVHNIGEIWAATLLELNRTIGKDLAVQLVVDALPLTPANPSFLDARDAILLAIDHMLQAGRLKQDEFNKVKADAWKVFAKFGMGVGAQSNGPSLEGVVASFDVPAA